MIIFNNIDNISEERFEYIKKRIITFLSIIFEGINTHKAPIKKPTKNTKKNILISSLY